MLKTNELTDDELRDALKSVEELLDLVNRSRLSGNFVKGIDTFFFRKGIFEEDMSIDTAIKEQVLSYVEETVDKSHSTYQTMKLLIDDSECSSDYFVCNPSRKFRGVYKPVVLKTIASMVLFELSKNSKDRLH
ncbi:hypothetical protein ACFSL6_27370 [Paenibacillus thailandensis]|uniref:Uncharacterized protein n=1 Tax=Paenibacillus thailandensis TaxID=393250 RepID=A0ABW5QRN0_9BACL